jgi:hypothetical protein
MRLYLLLIFAQLFVAFQVSGQANQRTTKGYIIENGQKVEGEIKTSLRRQLHMVCEFRPSAGTGFVQYRPSDIQGFFIEGEGHFKSRVGLAVDSLAPANFFLLEIVSGPISLFEMIGGDRKPKYFIEKDGELRQLIKRESLERGENGAYVKIVDHLYRRTLNVAFAGCPQNTQRISYVRSSMANAVRKYNQCADPNQKEQVVRERRRTYGGVSYGMMFNTVENDFPPYIDARGSQTYRFDLRNLSRKVNYRSSSVGFTYEFGFMRDKHFTAITGLLYSSGTIDHQAFKIEYTNLDVPLYLDYTMLLSSPVRPFIGAGFIFPIGVERKINQALLPGYIIDSNGNPVSNDGTPDAEATLQPNDNYKTSLAKLSATAGLAFFLNDRLKVTLQYRMEGARITNDPEIRLRQRGIFGTVALRVR